MARSPSPPPPPAVTGLLAMLAAVEATAPGAIEALVDLIADKLAERSGGGGAPKYADATNNPYGSARAFADAARREEFPTFIRARRVTALWTDVEAAIERRKRPVRPRKAAPPAPQSPLDDRALLERAGARLGGPADDTPPAPPDSQPRRRRAAR